MDRATVKIVGYNSECIDVCSSAARISTTKGDSLETFERSKASDSNINLINKVVRSGHNSVLEHAVFNLAFCNVTAYVEQHVIEHRLASYTIKSRRYVDFSDMGYYVPDSLGSSERDVYNSYVKDQFKAYGELLELGIPKEDARFVLPYCFYSNFYCTANAREIFTMIGAMRHGRGRGNAELASLADQLEEQLRELFPIDFKIPEDYPEPPAFAPFTGSDGQDDGIRLIDAPRSSAESIMLAHRIKTGKSPASPEELISALLLDKRPRELEALSYSLLIPKLSLSGITHLVRHRMLSPIVPPLSGVDASKHIVPATVSGNGKALSVYLSAFERCANAMAELSGHHEYLALSGNTLPVLITVNARELHHFFMLRLCTRAQWEIREVANEMLELLTAHDSTLFGGMGPSCHVKGFCPEGSMSCGRIASRK